MALVMSPASALPVVASPVPPSLAVPVSADSPNASLPGSPSSTTEPGSSSLPSTAPTTPRLSHLYEHKVLPDLPTATAADAATVRLRPSRVPLVPPADSSSSPDGVESLDVAEQLATTRARRDGDETEVLAGLEVSGPTSVPRQHSDETAPAEEPAPLVTPDHVQEPGCGCDDVVEPEHATTARTGKRAEFDAHRFDLPTEAQIQAAAECHLVGESGATVSFGDLIRERGSVVVVFLRHMWCGLCQEYVKALRSASRALASASTTTVSTHSEQAMPLYILLISSGSSSLIPIYRSRLDCPFPLYVDKRRTLYKTLGMNMKTWDAGSDKDKGSYVRISMGRNVVNSTKSALTMRAYPGSQKQLGGEFVFTVKETESDRIACTYASRMNTTRSHAEVRELFAAAGVHLSPEDEASVFGSVSSA